MDYGFHVLLFWNVHPVFCVRDFNAAKIRLELNAKYSMNDCYGTCLYVDYLRVHALSISTAL